MDSQQYMVIDLERLGSKRMWKSHTNLTHPVKVF